MSELLFNKLPRPTFRWLRVNHTPASLWETATDKSKAVVEGNTNIISPLPVGTPLMNPSYEGVNKDALDALVASGEGYVIHVPEKAHETIHIHINGEGPVESRFQFIVEKDGELEVSFYLEGGNEAKHTIQYCNEFDVKENGKVIVKKVNLLAETVQHIEHRYTKVEDNGDVEFINIEIGGEENYLQYDHDLVGESSKVVHDIAYLGNNEQKFDIAMLMSHKGKKSFTDIHTLGALSDKAKKSFRGTLDFIRGCTASEGAEEDTCLLLDPTVKSISLPLLLCKEDNVVGNHAASAGQIDQNKLFYLMSRGFSEDEAKHIIVESMIRPVIDRIGDEVIEEAALAAVRNKI